MSEKEPLNVAKTGYSSCGAGDREAMASLCSATTASTIKTFSRMRVSQVTGVVDGLTVLEIASRFSPMQTQGTC